MMFMAGPSITSLPLARASSPITVPQASASAGSHVEAMVIPGGSAVA
jgi:hypothetical protein